MTGNDPALTFVAQLDDEASKASKVLRGNLEDVARPLPPIKGDADLDVDKIVAALNKIDGHLDAFVKEAADAGEEAGEKAGKGFEGGISGVLQGGAIVAAGAAAGALIASSFQSALDQETDVAALVGSLGLTDEQAKTAGAVAGALYADAYGESMGDVTGAVEAVMSSIDGLRDGTDAALTAATEDALNFATAFETDVTRSTQIVGQLIRTGLVADAEEGFDLLIAASQKVPAAVREDLLDAADEYGPFFAALGYSGEEAFAALVAGSEKGMYGIDKTGDAIKELGIRATDMSTASVAAYEAAGLNAEDMAAKFAAGGDMARGGLTELIDGLLGIEDPVARANAAIGLFGTPLEDLGVTEIPAFLEGLKGGTDGMGDFSQKSEELSDTLNGTAAVALEEQTRLLQQMGTDALAKLMPHLLDFLSWLQETPGFLTALTVGLVAAGIAWATVTLAASPWLALALGIAAAIAALVFVIQNWGPIMDWIGEKIAAVGDWIGETFDKVRQWVSDKVAQIIEWVKGHWPLLLAILTGPIGLAVLWISQHMDEIKATVSEKITAVIDFFRNLPGQILSALGNLAGTLVSAGGDLVRGLWDGIKGMGTWLVNKLTSWVADVIPGPIARALGIASPSKVGAELGEWFAIGLGEGVAAETDYAERQAENLADAIVAPMNGLGVGLDNITPAVSIAGRTDLETTVRIEHVITSPDGSVTTLTAQEIATLIARDPVAAATTEKAVRSVTQRRDARTLTATNV